MPVLLSFGLPSLHPSDSFCNFPLNRSYASPIFREQWLTFDSRAKTSFTATEVAQKRIPWYVSIAPAFLQLHYNFTNLPASLKIYWVSQMPLARKWSTGHFEALFKEAARPSGVKHIWIK